MSNPTSTRQFFLDLIEGHKPDCFFDGQTDFSKWHANFFARFRECLGALPEAIPLTLETQWEGTEDGIHKNPVATRALTSNGMNVKVIPYYQIAMQ